jgi:hypothetical protein
MQQMKIEQQQARRKAPQAFGKPVMPMQQDA